MISLLRSDAATVLRNPALTSPFLSWPAIPENDYYFEFEGPCPRCTYSYGYAIGYNEGMMEEMEEAYMEDYEEMMMEQMAEEMYGIGLYD